MFVNQDTVRMEIVVPIHLEYDKLRARLQPVKVKGFSAPLAIGLIVYYTGRNEKIRNIRGTV
jgi:hypothetical protein